MADTQIASNLAGLQRSYQTAVNSGQSPSALAGLAKQITDAAQTLGMGADLPRSTAASPAPVATSTKIDVHA